MCIMASTDSIFCDSFVLKTRSRRTLCTRIRTSASLCQFILREYAVALSLGVFRTHACGAFQRVLSTVVVKKKKN